MMVAKHSLKVVEHIVSYLIVKLIFMSHSPPSVTPDLRTRELVWKNLYSKITELQSRSQNEITL